MKIINEYIEKHENLKKYLNNIRKHSAQVFLLLAGINIFLFVLSFLGFPFLLFLDKVYIKIFIFFYITRILEALFYGFVGYISTRDGDYPKYRPNIHDAVVICD